MWSLGHRQQQHLELAGNRFSGCATNANPLNQKLWGGPSSLLFNTPALDFDACLGLDHAAILSVTLRKPQI